VLTIGSFHAGVAFNVIAEQACLTGTLRSFNPEVRSQMIRRMEEVLAGTCAAHGASYLFELADHTPAVINDAYAAELAAEAAATVVNPDRLGRDAPLMVAEDFAEIAQKVPACYLLVGAEPPGGAQGAHHSPRFDIDETSLPLAAALMSSVAVRFLRRSLLAGPHNGDPAA
jgi:amidohydrolase